MQEVTIINTANKQQIRCKQTDEGQYVEFLALKQSKTNKMKRNIQKILYYIILYII